VVPSFEFTRFFFSGQWTSIDDDKPPCRMKGFENVIQDCSGMRKFVVGVRHEHGINLRFRQVGVVWVTVN
jgi:hypothetical protein